MADNLQLPPPQYQTPPEQLPTVVRTDVVTEPYSRDVIVTFYLEDGPTFAVRLDEFVGLVLRANLRHGGHLLH